MDIQDFTRDMIKEAGWGKVIAGGLKALKGSGAAKAVVAGGRKAGKYLGPAVNTMFGISMAKDLFGGGGAAPQTQQAARQRSHPVASRSPYRSNMRRFGKHASAKSNMTKTAAIFGGAGIAAAGALAMKAAPFILKGLSAAGTAAGIASVFGGKKKAPGMGKPSGIRMRKFKRF